MSHSRKLSTGGVVVFLLNTNGSLLKQKTLAFTDNSQTSSMGYLPHDIVLILVHSISTVNKMAPEIEKEFLRKTALSYLSKLWGVNVNRFDYEVY